MSKPKVQAETAANIYKNCKSENCGGCANIPFCRAQALEQHPAANPSATAAEIFQREAELTRASTGVASRD